MSAQLPTYPPEQQNIAMGERGLSVAAGLMIAAAAVRPRPNPLLSLLALTIGGYLAFRGATGYCPVKANMI